MSDDARPVADVRMRGFDTLTPVARVLELINGLSGRRREELVGLSAAGGRALAQFVVATTDVPHFRRAAMDGYAARLADLPGNLLLAGEARAGRMFADRLLVGQVVRVMTGAPVPDEADVVIPVEQATVKGNTVRIRVVPPAGKHVIGVGEDVAAGQHVFSSGRRLRPQDVGLLSSLGIPEVAVFAKPRVKIVTTGGELLPAGTPPTGFQIPDSNSVMLRAFAERDGGTVTAVHVPDDPARIRAEVTADDYDVLLTTGGTSVGVDDHTPPVVRSLATTFVHGVDMKPGMPTGFGILPDGRAVFLLPGNPVGCLFAYDLLARVLIQRLAGRPPVWPYPMADLTLSEPIISKAGRVDYVRVRMDLTDRKAIPFVSGGAANLSGPVAADGFIIVDAAVDRLDAGTPTMFYLYE